MCLCVGPVMNCGLGLVCQLGCGQWLNNLSFKPIKKESMFFPFQCFAEKGMRSLFFKYSSSRQRGVHWPAETSVCLQQSCVHCNQTFSVSDRELPVYVNLHLTQTSAALWPLCFFYSSRFSWTQFPHSSFTFHIMVSEGHTVCPVLIWSIHIVVLLPPPPWKCPAS